MLNILREKQEILYADNVFSGDYNQVVYLKKSAGGNVFNEPDKYYINIYSYIDGVRVLQGYIYFYVDKKNKTSNFIGLKVEPQYSNLNIGSFLVASWINFCFNNGLDFLGTNKKQRKPFLLYLLKTYGFEILDKTLYSTRKDVITICQSLDINDKRKLLLFKSPQFQNSFQGTNVYKSDNYDIAIPEEVRELDKVILVLQNQSKKNVNYLLLDSDKACQKAEMVLKRHMK